jgi:hypothetical protein
LYIMPAAQKAAALRAKANERQRESRKRKRAEKEKEKMVKHGEVVELESGDEVELRGKKAKQAQKITVYIHIQTPAVQTKGRAKTTESKPIVKGPCFFTSDDDYEKFKETLAKSIPCKLKLLPITQMHW